MQHSRSIHLTTNLLNTNIQATFKMKQSRKDHTMSLILLFLTTSSDVAAFVPASMTAGKPSQTLLSFDWKRNNRRICKADTNAIHKTLKLETINDILDNVNGIGEALNGNYKQSDEFPVGPGKAPLPSQGLAECHHIAEISSITTLTSSQNTGAEILANESFETRILLKYGKNNIIKGSSKESHPSQEVVDQKRGQYIETPGVLNIMKFAIPAVGVWLCGPLLSLIDTSTVGLLSGTAQQAALGPAVAVADYSALLLVSRYLHACIYTCVLLKLFITSL
mmetsp:Transcript_9253/g.13732  ORF Transcript_9253/g.13732 Transcript_9253/m.13732 type:complete len:279 (-) Transcript_9253:1781-2617(-)